MEIENRTETEVNNEERGLDSSGRMAAVLGHLCSHQTGVFFQNGIKCYPAYSRNMETVQAVQAQTRNSVATLYLFVGREVDSTVD